MVEKIKDPIDTQGKLPWEFLFPIIFSLYLLFSMVSISVSQIFLALSLFCWLVFLIKEKQKLLIPSFFWPLIVYSGLSIISSFRSVNTEISLKDSKELLLFLIVPIVYTGFRQANALKKASLALLASAYLCSLYSIFYFLFKAQPGERITGFMGHYMTQAGILILFCSIALSLFFFLREKVRFLWGIGVLLALFPLALTQTRSAWIGLIIAVSLIILLYRPKALIIIPIAVGLFFIASPHHIKKRALSIFSLESYSNKLRIEYTKAGIKIIRDFPLLGSGPDTVDMVFQDPKYGLSEDAKRNVHLHNNFTQIAAERGIPAVLAWIAFLAWAFISLVRLLKNKDPTIYAFTVAGLAAILALVTAGFFEYNFGDSEITTLFLFMITAPFTLDLIQKRETEDS
jgi:O-antigen ligase